MMRRKKKIDHFQPDEKLFKLVAENVDDLIAVLDLKGRRIYNNPAYQKLIGDPDALIRTNSFQEIHPDDREKIKEIFQKTVETGVGQRTEYRLLLKDGSIRYIESQGNVIRDIKGKPTNVVVVSHDVTEKREADRQLRLLAHALTSTRDCFCLTDLQWNILFVNPAFCETYGYSEAELIGKNITIVNSSQNPPDLSDQIHKETLAGGWKGELINRRKDGGEFPTELWTSIVHDDDGEPVAFVGIWRDITERRKAKQQLERSEEKYRALFEELQDGIYISTPDGKLLDLNPAAMEIFGITSGDELEKIDIEKDFYFNSLDREIFKRNLARQGFVRDFENVIKRKDGQRCTVLETTTVVRDNTGKIIAYRGFIRDITQQKILEEQLRQSQKMENIGTLAGGIAHDFNNLLSIISGYVQLLKNSKLEPAKVKRSVEAINQAVDRGANLVKQMLTFARKAEAIYEPVKVNDTIQELAKMFNHTFPKSIKISLDLDDNLPYILADAGQLHQTILNLSVNARDAMVEGPEEAPGGSTLTLKTATIDGVKLRQKFSTALADTYAVVSIKDNGVGMDEVTKTRIFEPFFTTKGVGKGTGLGLAVVYGFVNSHHGYIDVESTKGVGTTFNLYFPIQEGIGEELPIQETQPHVIKGGSETLLVVEDEEMLLELLRGVLHDHGYKVLMARDGLEALSVYQHNMDQVTLVLSDMGLPKLGGWEMFLQLKKMNPKIKMILASGYLNPDLKKEMLQEGAKDFIQKPYIVNEILYRIREVIDSTSE